MTFTFEAWGIRAGRPLRTFNARDLAEQYAADMGALGTEIIIKTSRLDRCGTGPLEVVT